MKGTTGLADPNTGVAVFGLSGRRNRSAWLVFGGTSVCAPLYDGPTGLGTPNGVAAFGF